jgi:hypothetical protein
MSEWKATYSQNYEDIADGLRVQKPGETFLPSEMAQAIEDINNDISAAYTACENKGATLPVAQVSANLAGTINSIPAGGGTTAAVTADFYDFAGNLVRSYTADEIAALSELPEAPEIQGFSFQGWNWTLPDIKSWSTAAESGHLCVGGVYVTADGHTRIYMKFTEPRMAVVAMPFCIQQMSGTVLIDWGDNSAPETITAAGVYYHTWNLNAYPADVVIDIQYTPSGTTKLVLGRAVGSTTYGLFNNDPLYAKCVQTVELGENIDFLTYSATFNNCQNLSKINFPTSVGIFSSNLLRGCDNLGFVVVPSGVTSIGNSVFFGCTNLGLTALPDGVTSIGNNAFQNCTNLGLTALPDGVTSIGNSAFLGCTNLGLTALPSGVTSVGTNAFYGCTNLGLTALPSGVTIIGNSAFQNCTNLGLIALPSGVTSIGNSVFQNCTNLGLTALPDGVTSIGNNAFQNCTNLGLTALPDGVTSIGSYAFQNCTTLYIVDLTAFTNPTAIPTLSNANAFSGIPAQARFIVANAEMLAVFSNATNWNTFAARYEVES